MRVALVVYFLIQLSRAALDMSEHSWSAGEDPGGFHASSGYSPPSKDISFHRDSGFYYVTGKFTGTARLGTNQVCKGVKVTGAHAYTQTPQSCYTAPAVEMTSYGATDMYVAKYGPQHKLIWVKRIGGQGFDRGSALAVDNIRDEPDQAPSYSYDKGFKVPGDSRGNHLHEANPRRELSSMPRNEDSDTHVFVAGVTDMGKDAVADNFLLENKPEARQAWMVKTNASSGEIIWGRTLAHCLSTGVNGTYQPFDINDQRNNNYDNMGDCRPKSVAVDGHGDVIVTGSFYGSMAFPDVLSFEPNIRKWTQKQTEQLLGGQRGANNMIKRAIGMLAYCNLATWKELGCIGAGSANVLGSAEKIFDFSITDMDFELEESDTAIVILSKVRDKLRIADINNLYLEEDIQVEVPQYLPDGRLTDPILETVSRNISDDTLLQSFFEKKNVTLTVCNTTIYQTNRLMNTSKICNVTKVEPTCKDSISEGDCNRVFKCPEKCRDDTDCSNNEWNSMPSFCYFGTCAVNVGMCQQWAGFKRVSRLDSRDKCYTRGGRGRSCQHDWFVAKMGRHGDFQWASKVWEEKRPTFGADAMKLPNEEVLYWEARALEYMGESKEKETDDSRLDNNYPYNSPDSNFSYYQAARHAN